jgi:hypothetical protein
VTKWLQVRSLQLETALSSFVEEAALKLQETIAAGGEVPFELATQEARGQRTPLYCYRPLTAAFIAEHAATLKALSSHAPAARLLESFDGLDRYLLAHDAGYAGADRQSRANAALRSLLEDVFEEQADFELHPGRLRDALRVLDESAFADFNELTLVATLHGLTIASPELTLAPGLLIARPDALRGAPEGAVARGEAYGGDHLLIVFSADADRIDPAAGVGGQDVVAEGSEVLRELLRALRLFGDGRVTLGALAWARVGGGSWNPLALGVSGRPHGMLVVGIEQEDELRAFCNLVSRRTPRDNELAWALERFELGCERAHEYEGLSDYLLALRALLAPSREGEPESHTSGLLAGRLAALCATPERRTELTQRILQALALERAIIAGTAVEHSGGQALVRDLADHLRALLRDVICGHLDPDLVVLADELLLAGGGESQTEPCEEAQSDPWETDQLNLAGLPG